MTIWDRQWYGPSAEIRTYLFQKLVLLLVGCDAIVLMAARSGRYGIDGFNVAHFPWLDWLQPTAPNATWCSAVLVAVSLFAFYIVLFGHRRSLMVLLTAIYTYSWAMSRLDSYLHHYMISIILSCVTCFPTIDARALYESLRNELPSQAKRNHVGKRQAHVLQSSVPSDGWRFTWASILLLAAYRIGLTRAVGLAPWQRWVWMSVCFGMFVAFVCHWIRKYGYATGPTRSAWAVRLLVVTVGVIYVFAAVAKFDSEWLAGHTLRRVGATEYVLAPVQQFAERIAISADQFWATLATAVIPLELTIAASYLLSVRQDEQGRSWLRRWCICAWVLAMMLHLNNEMMELIIQWFGYYMIFLATFLLLPITVLSSAAVPVVWLSASCLLRRDEWLEQHDATTLVRFLFVCSAATMAMLLLGAAVIPLPGALAACGLAVAFAACLLVVGIAFPNLVANCIRSQLALAAAALLTIAAVWQSSMPFRYHSIRGQELLVLGGNQNDPEAKLALTNQAITDYERALRYMAPDNAQATDSEINLALAYRQRNQADDMQQAERHFRRAIEIDQKAFLAHYSLANLLRDEARYAEAATAYLAAISIKADFSDAHANLAGVYEFQGQFAAALQHYRAALAIEPNAVDLRMLMQNAERRVAGQPND